MQRKKILIAGVSSSLGTSLAEFLLENNYSVLGLTRKSSTKLGNRSNLKVYDNFDYQNLQELSNMDFDVFISFINYCLYSIGKTIKLIVLDNETAINCSSQCWYWRSPNLQWFS